MFALGIDMTSYELPRTECAQSRFVQWWRQAVRSCENSVNCATLPQEGSTGASSLAQRCCGAKWLAWDCEHASETNVWLWVISPRLSREPLRVDLIDPAVFKHLTPGPVKYRASVPIPYNHAYTVFIFIFIVIYSVIFLLNWDTTIFKLSEHPKARSWTTFCLLRI